MKVMERDDKLAWGVPWLEFVKEAHSRGEADLLVLFFFSKC